MESLATLASRTRSMLTSLLTWSTGASMTKICLSGSKLLFALKDYWIMMEQQHS